MTIDTTIKKIIELIGCLFIGIVVIIGTFPENDWSFSIGIDPPLMWVYNHLFATDIALGKHIIFPHGPLAFFSYPSTENILLSTLITSLLKIMMVLNLFLLLQDEKKNKRWIYTAVAAYGFSIFSNFNNLLLINILLLYCNYFITEKNIFKFFLFVLTAFAFYIKAYTAIVTILYFVSFIFYYLYHTKKIKQLLIDCFCMLVCILLFWVGMYHTLDGFSDYIIGIAHLSEDNSSAVSNYPYNNWLVLFLFFLFFSMFFLINRTKKTFFYTSLIGLGLFASWKHGMAREDIAHIFTFFLYIIIYLALFILFQRKKMLAIIGLAIATLITFSINLKNAIGFHLIFYDVYRGQHFFSFVSHFPELKQQALTISQNNIAAKKLPKEIRAILSNATTDVYPWDYSIIAANKLNWQPRVVIQSYAAYTHWLDQKNAAHFNSAAAPVYLIWELNKINSDINGSQLNSIDNRYLLNDEPQTLLEVLKNYSYYYSDSNFLLLKKRRTPLSISTTHIAQTHSGWSRWIGVPKRNGDLLKAKLHFNKTFIQQIKSVLYKDEQFWIYLKLKNGLIHKYRIVPKNAVDGLWINPYVFDQHKSYTIESIMFKCSSQHLLTDQITIDWEETKFLNEQAVVEHFFNIQENIPDTMLFSSAADYEKQVINWDVPAPENITNDAFSGRTAVLVKANSCSPCFSLSLDSIPSANLKIVADCWIKSPGYKLANKILFVLSIDHPEGNTLIQVAPVDYQFIDEEHWNNIYNFVNYTNNKKQCKLEAYLYNTSNTDVLLDDFRVILFKN